jgi:glutamyl-tRNA synthetase
MDAGTPYVIRLKVPRNEEIRFHDIIRGWIVVNSTQVDDKVLIKSDGMPTYHLAHIVDDIEMEISHAVRGEEWLPSAPSHVLIYRYLGMEDKMPQLAHLPLILKPDGSGKLSKRDKSGLPMFPLDWTDPRDNQHYVGYRESGFFPEAFMNMLAMLGWNPGTTQEIFTKEELIAAFSFERVNKSGAKFDPEKTKWFNQQYLRMQPDEKLAEMFRPMLSEKLKELNVDISAFSDEYIKGVCRLVKEKAHFVSEFWSNASFFFVAPASYDADVVKKRWNEQSAAFVKELKSSFEAMIEFTAANAEATFKAIAEKMGIGAGQVMQLFRVCVSGLGGGPQLFEMVELLGKDEVVKRLETASEKIGS